VQPELAVRVRLLNTGSVQENGPTIPGPSPLPRCVRPTFGRPHAGPCDLVASGFPKQISAIQASTVRAGIETVDAVDGASGHQVTPRPTRSSESPPRGEAEMCSKRVMETSIAYVRVHTTYRLVRAHASSG
jgi:hypothetical protein